MGRRLILERLAEAAKENLKNRTEDILLLTEINKEAA